MIKSRRSSTGSTRDVPTDRDGLRVDDKPFDSRSALENIADKSEIATPKPKMELRAG